MTVNTIRGPRRPQNDGDSNATGNKRNSDSQFPADSRKKGRQYMRRPPGRPPKRGWRSRFLWAVSVTGNKTQAARSVGIARSTVITWEARDTTFRRAVERAKQEARQERAAIRYYYNPSLTTLLGVLAAARPHKYGSLEKALARQNRRNPKPHD